MAYNQPCSLSVPMSDQGQFRKSDCATAMSAFPPLATELRTSLEVRFVLETEQAGLSEVRELD